MVLEVNLFLPPLFLPWFSLPDCMPSHCFLGLCSFPRYQKETLTNLGVCSSRSEEGRRAKEAGQHVKNLERLVLNREGAGEPEELSVNSGKLCTALGWQQFRKRLLCRLVMLIQQSDWPVVGNKKRQLWHSYLCRHSVRASFGGPKWARGWQLEGFAM